MHAGTARTHRARRRPRNLVCTILRKTERGACETTSATRRVWKWRAVAIVWKWIRSPLAAEAATVTNWLSSWSAFLPACLSVCLPTRNVAVEKAASLTPCLVKLDAYSRGPMPGGDACENAIALAPERDDVRKSRRATIRRSRNACRVLRDRVRQYAISRFVRTLASHELASLNEQLAARSSRARYPRDLVYPFTSTRGD